MFSYQTATKMSRISSSTKLFMRYNSYLPIPHNILEKPVVKYEPIKPIPHNILENPVTKFEPIKPMPHGIISGVGSYIPKPFIAYCNHNDTLFISEIKEKTYSAYSKEK